MKTITALEAEIKALRACIKELTESFSNNQKTLEDFYIYDTGCGCCSGSTSLLEAIEEENLNPVYKYKLSTSTVLLSFDCLME